MGRTGGGAGLYLRDTFNFNIMSDLCSSNSALFDSVFVEIENPHGKNLIIGRVYRPPSANLHAFLESFQQLLDRVTRDNKMCYIMGDFNLDLLNTDLHSATNEFINALFSHFLYPLISRPTRLTSYSATLIDNIFTNNISAVSALCDNGLIINDLSDHLPIFTHCYTDAHSSNIKSKKSVAIRNFSSQNIKAFDNLLCELLRLD